MRSRIVGNKNYNNRTIHVSLVAITIILWLSDVPFFTAIGCSFLFLFQCFLGRYALSFVRNSDQSIFQLFGSSFSAGAVIFTLVSLIVREITTYEFAIPLVILVSVFFLIFQRNEFKTASNYSNEQLIAIGLSVLIMLSVQFIWYLGPFTLLFLILQWRKVRDIKTGRLNIAISVSMFTTGILLIYVLKTKYWWITSDDYQFFEAISNSIGNWGLNENAVAVEGNVYNWHFLTYAWSGNMDVILKSDSWVFLTRCTPILATISIISLLFEISTQVLPNIDLRSRLIGTLTTAIVSEISWYSPSYAFTIIWLLATILYISEIPTSSFKYRLSIFIGIFIGITALGKVSMIPILVLLLINLWIFSLLNRNSLQRFYLCSGVSGVFSLLFIYLLSYQNSTAKSVIWFRSVNQLRKQYWTQVDSTEKFSIIAGAIVQHMTLPIIVCVSVTVIKCDSRNFLRIWAINSSVLLIFSQLFIDGWTSSVEYFFAPAYFSLSILLGLVVSSNLRLVDSIWRRIQYLPLGLLFSVITVLIYGQSKIRDSSLLFLLALIVLLVSFYRSFKGRNTHRDLVVLATFIPILFLQSFAFPVARHILPLLTTRNERVDVEQFIGSSDVEETGKWLLENTDINSVVATNSFCAGEDCLGSDWFTAQLRVFKTTPSILSNDCDQCDINSLFGGANFLLADYSKRRFLIQGPRFLFGLQYPPTWVIKRMEFSLSFTNSSENIRNSKMKEFGVDYFVVDRKAAHGNSYLSSNYIVFRNVSFVVIRRPY